MTTLAPSVVTRECFPVKRVPIPTQFFVFVLVLCFFLFVFVFNFVLDLYIFPLAFCNSFFVLRFFVFALGFRLSFLRFLFQFSYIWSCLLFFRCRVFFFRSCILVFALALFFLWIYFLVRFALVLIFSFFVAIFLCIVFPNLSRLCFCFCFFYEMPSLFSHCFPLVGLSRASLVDV